MYTITTFYCNSIIIVTSRQKDDLRTEADQEAVARALAEYREEAVPTRNPPPAVDVVVPALPHFLQQRVSEPHHRERRTPALLPPQVHARRTSTRRVLDRPDVVDRLQVHGRVGRQRAPQGHQARDVQRTPGPERERAHETLRRVLHASAHHLRWFRVCFTGGGGRGRGGEGGLGGEVGRGGEGAVLGGGGGGGAGRGREGGAGR